VHAFIVSDLHLGSSETRHEAFSRFLDDLPAGATLILNGDIANDATKSELRMAEARSVLDEIRRESFQRPVIWLGGNNDTGYRPGDPGRIEFRDELALGRDLYVCHGHKFLTLPGDTDGLQKLIRLFIGLFHRERERTMHMANYLRRVPPLYRIACRVVARGAIRYARKHGYAAITCGHTHHAETLVQDGIRYFNTGAWTEDTPHYLSVSNDSIILCAMDTGADVCPC